MALILLNFYRMRALRIRRLFLIMVLSVLALAVRLSHADELYQKAAHILAKITELEKPVGASNDNVNFHKFMQVADELEALHSSSDLRKRTLFKMIEEKMGNLLERFKHNHPAEHALIRGMNAADLWTSHDLPFLIEKIEAGKSSEMTESLILIGKKLDPNQQKKLRDALVKHPTMENYALIYESGLRSRDDLITLIRIFEGRFVELLELGKDTEPSIALADFPIGMQFVEYAEKPAVEKQALHHLVERYKERDLNIHVAVREAEKQGPLFLSPFGDYNPRSSAMFYERLTKTGFDDCNSEWTN